MRTRLLILDNAVHRFLFRPHGHWSPYLRAADADVVNVPSGRPVPPLDGYTHLLLTGSEASIVDPKPWFEREADVVREARDRRLPTLGSCFGHQMLVLALSGPLHLIRSSTPEIGWIALEKLDDDDLIADAPDPWITFSYHFDEVVDPPPPWRVLARSRDCPTHVIRYGDLPIWGIQAHPELSLAKARLFLGLYLLFAERDRRRLISAMRRPSREDRIADRIAERFLASRSGG
jgi:GMP synthase-like glutamine amidotransferase